MAIKHIILLFVETPNFFVLKARRPAGRVVDRKLPIREFGNATGSGDGDVCRTWVLHNFT
jgi:hypothetical protein